MSGRHQWKNFRNRCIITLFTLILVHPLDWRKCANFKRLYFLNGCIDLDVQYTVGKDMTRSTSWPNFIGKVYHLQGQNIGQTSENSVFGFYYACKAAVSRIYDAWSRRPPASASHCDSCATCSIKLSTPLNCSISCMWEAVQMCRANIYSTSSNISLISDTSFENQTSRED